MPKLIATRPLRYNTRSLVAGDEFEATDMHARILVGIRKARHAPEKPTAPVTAATATADFVEYLRPHTIVREADPPDVPDIDRLRREAQQLGIEVDGRWGETRLRHEITLAKQRR